MTKEKVGEFLAQQAFKRTITNYQLSEATGIDRSTIGRILGGTREPGAINLFKILKALNISKSELYKFIKDF